MPAITAPACLGAITDELAVLAPTCHFDPRDQHKARFKSLLQQKKGKNSGSAPASIGRSRQLYNRCVSYGNYNTIFAAYREITLHRSR